MLWYMNIIATVYSYVNVSVAVMYINNVAIGLDGKVTLFPRFFASYQSIRLNHHHK